MFNTSYSHTAHVKINHAYETLHTSKLGFCAESDNYIKMSDEILSIAKSQIQYALLQIKLKQIKIKLRDY